MREILAIRPRTWQDVDGVLCVISTRVGGASSAPLGLNLGYTKNDQGANVEANRKLFFEHVGADANRICFANQCHSARVRKVAAPGIYESCDGFVTSEQCLWLAISVADCLPVFLFDPIRHVVGAIHAGWRGTSAQIALRGVRLMQQEFGSDPRTLMAFIGPGAGACCYEVKSDVADYFADKFVKVHEGTMLLDLKEANRHQLAEAGLLEEKIEVHPDCTICTPELYHSYRRDGERSGRMLGMIALT